MKITDSVIIRNKPLNMWSGDIRLRLYKLSYLHGLMRGFWCVYNQDRKNIDTFVCFVNKKPVGWASIENKHIMVYVNRKYRNSGFAKKLVKRALKKYKRLSCHGNKEFFEQFEIYY